MTVSLPVARPSERGVDPRGILTFLEAAATDPRLEPHSLVILRRGTLVAEGYWAPYRADDRPLAYSVSKTLVATAVGLAVGEGLLALDDRIVDLLPSDVPPDAGARVREITVHHLLAMSTGHDTDTIAALQARPPSEWARAYLSLEPAAPVGSRHVYDNGASWLCGELVRRRSGESLLGYLRARVLAPLGLGDVTWDADPLGREYGWSGAHVPTRGLAALGELYRCDGVWEGRRLLPPGWAAQVGTCHIPSTNEKPDWTLGYGYQVWQGREGYRLDGAYGQFSFVLGERESVIALTGGQSSTQELVDLIWEHLVPALGAMPDASAPDTEARAAEEQLAARLAGLSLAAPADAGASGPWRAAGPVATDPTLSHDPETQRNLPSLADVHAGRDAGGFVIAMTYAGRPIRLQVPEGGESWRRTSLLLGDVAVPVAVTAGADAAGGLSLDVAFVETPHILHLRVEPSHGTAGMGRARMAWNVPPLHEGGLEALRAH